jgi:hypothetical protein
MLLPHHNSHTSSRYCTFLPIPTKWHSNYWLRFYAVDVLEDVIVAMETGAYFTATNIASAVRGSSKVDH